MNTRKAVFNNRVLHDLDYEFEAVFEFPALLNKSLDLVLDNFIVENGTAKEIFCVDNFLTVCGTTKTLGGLTIQMPWHMPTPLKATCEYKKSTGWVEITDG